MLKERDLKISFWLVYLVLVLVSIRNVVTDDWLVTVPVALLSLFLISLVAFKAVASRRRWSAVAVLMGSLVIMAVLLREVLWIQQYSVLDRRVLFLVVLAIVAVIGRMTHAWRTRHRHQRAKALERNTTRKKRRRSRRSQRARLSPDMMDREGERGGDG
ncbi:MAG: hypothetical protein GY732_13435 [Gammaproteobacteria bacterium]|nr:hypothetical protein [Gammaproteobacteria bacterium]